MTRMVFCQKLHQELAGMDDAPYPNELGQRIYEHISQQAWEAWINHQSQSFEWLSCSFELVCHHRWANRL